MLKNIRGDAERWRALLLSRGIRRLWHFTPLVCVPCILFHRAVLSVSEQDRLKLIVPPRASRDDDVVGRMGRIAFVALASMLDHIKGQNDVLWFSIVVGASQREQLLVSEFCGNGTGDLDYEFPLGYWNRYC